MSNTDFKIIANKYALLSKEIKEASKQIRDIKKQKDQMGETLLGLMKQQNLDECQLPDGCKIIKKVSKRTESLKPEMILEELRQVLGDDAKAEACLQNIQSKRNITENDYITFSEKRGSTSPKNEDVDDISTDV